jgi:hypothetical protein
MAEILNQILEVIPDTVKRIADSYLRSLVIENQKKGTKGSFYLQQNFDTLFEVLKKMFVPVDDEIRPQVITSDQPQLGEANPDVTSLRKTNSTPASTPYSSQDTKYRTIEIRIGIIQMTVLNPMKTRIKIDSNIEDDVGGTMKGLASHILQEVGESPKRGDPITQIAKPWDQIPDSEPAQDINNPTRQQTQTGEIEKPWEQIPDSGLDWSILELFYSGIKEVDIGKYLNYSRVKVRLSELRKQFGDDIVPYARDIRKKLISKKVVTLRNQM